MMILYRQHLNDKGPCGQILMERGGFKCERSKLCLTRTLGPKALPSFASSNRQTRSRVSAETDWFRHPAVPKAEEVLASQFTRVQILSINT